MFKKFGKLYPIFGGILEKYVNFLGNLLIFLEIIPGFFFLQNEKSDFLQNLS